MAHEIYVTRDGQASMAFVGGTPWHGLGQSLTEGAPLETWACEAGFEWSALSAPVTFTRADGSVCQYSDKQAIYRSDTGRPLSVMGDGYKIVQPIEVIEFFRDLAASGGWQLNTAGILKGGRLMWAMAKNCAQADVVPGDRVRSNLLLVTSLDGSTPTTGALVATRVVCANTVRMALNEVREKGTKGVSRVSHRSTFDASEMKRALGVAPEVFADFMDQARALAAKPCDLEEARAMLRKIFGDPVRVKFAKVAATVDQAPTAPIAADVGADLQSLLSAPYQPKDYSEVNARTEMLKLIARTGSEREQKSVARCLELFSGAGRGANHEGVAGTRWGLLNAVTEHIDHEQGRTDDSRLHSAWFGRGDAFKDETLRLLTA